MSNRSPRYVETMAIGGTTRRSMVALLVRHGDGPGGKNADDALREYQRGGGDYL